jgi:predicted DNA-binding mobile mystery protein A
MRPKFRELRVKQLSRSIVAFDTAKAVARPHLGWLRAIREAIGMSLREVGKGMGVTPQLVASLEKSEANNRITLRSLEMAADAMGCKLVYAIVPKAGTLQELRERRARREVEEQVRAVEHMMALENQAVGALDEKIAEETKGRLKRG